MSSNATIILVLYEIVTNTIDRSMTYSTSAQISTNLFSSMFLNLSVVHFSKNKPYSKIEIEMLQKFLHRKVILITHVLKKFSFVHFLSDVLVLNRIQKFYRNTNFFSTFRS